MNPRIHDLVKRRPELSGCVDDLMRAYEAMCDCYRHGGKLLLCGNGGSAADAEHWAGELLKGFCHKRPLHQMHKDLLPADLAQKLQYALPAIPLTGFISLSSAFLNDVDPILIYAQLVWGLGVPGDVLVGISTSGNAKNVCAAMEAAKARGLFRVGLSGRTGGRLLAHCDVCIRAPSDETYLIQEFHLPICHTLCLMLEDEFFVNSKQPG
jgi:D-sedoheptulose 7-phosphate isomerase